MMEMLIIMATLMVIQMIIMMMMYTYIRRLELHLQRGPHRHRHRSLRYVHHATRQDPGDEEDAHGSNDDGI